jgi:hypothetical protein
LNEQKRIDRAATADDQADANSQVSISFPVQVVTTTIVVPVKWIFAFFKNATTQAILVMGLVLLVGGVAGGVIDHWLFSSRAVVRVTSNTTNDPQLVSHGYVHDVTIINTYNKPDPSVLPPSIGRSLDFCNAQYVVTGSSNPVIEVFKDADEGTKTNSGDVYAQCQLYALNSNSPKSGKPVTVAVTGIRDTGLSLFRNIILLVPSG